MANQMSDLDRIGGKFLTLLPERRAEALRHIHAAIPLGSQDELAEGQKALHQIAGIGGSVGYAELGQAARRCEDHILSYLDGFTPWSEAFQTTLLGHLQTFEAACETALEGAV